MIVGGGCRRRPMGKIRTWSSAGRRPVLYRARSVSRHYARLEARRAPRVVGHHRGPDAALKWARQVQRAKVIGPLQARDARCRRGSCAATIDPTAPDHVFDLQPALLWNAIQHARAAAGLPSAAICRGWPAVASMWRSSMGSEALGIGRHCRPRSPRRLARRLDYPALAAEVQLAVVHVAAAHRIRCRCAAQQADQFLAGGRRHRSARITSARPRGAKPRPRTSMPAHAPAALPCMAARTAHGRAGEPSSSLRSACVAGRSIDGLGTPLGPPGDYARAAPAAQIAGVQQAHHDPHGVAQDTPAVARLVDHRLGHGLSRRSSVPVSTLVSALANKQRLIRSQVRALIALIVSCRTDFFGHQCNGSRAKARNDAESDR